MSKEKHREDLRPCQIHRKHRKKESAKEHRETQDSGVLETKGGASFKNVETAVSDLRKDKEYQLEKEPWQSVIRRLLIVKLQARLKRIK